MQSRLFALFVAIVMVCSAFASSGVGAAVAFGPTAVAVSAELPTLPHGGSSGDHLLGDQAAQAQAERTLDLTALFLVRPAAAAPALTMAWPRPRAATAWLAPYLEGPQRPPCATPQLA